MEGGREADARDLGKRCSLFSPDDGDGGLELVGWVILYDRRYLGAVGDGRDLDSDEMGLQCWR